MIARLRRRLSEPVDASGLVAFRALYGGLMAFAAIRTLLTGWVDRLWVEPTFHFRYLGFGWVEPLPPWAMHGAFAAMAALAFLVALGILWRPALAVFLLLFTYVELVDVTTYLNHYYLVSLLGLLLLMAPLRRGRRDVPLLSYALLRFQVGAVYTFAAVAKAQPDWLLHAEPLQIWLAARTDTPVLGPLFGSFEVALLFSWAGFLHDLAMPWLLLSRRTRRFAWPALVVFHVVTAMLFHIGMFPWIMIAASTVFFEPGWTRRILGRSRPAPATTPAAPVRIPRPAFALAAAYVFVQVALPLRAFAYPGDVLWGEAGMRWSWRVMVREKNGSVSYRVRVPGEEKVHVVSPRRYLTAEQEQEMSGQPDLVLQLAHEIARDFRERGFGEVEVRADAFVSWNGRPAAPMIDPGVDLAKVPDGLGTPWWVTDPPESPPRRLRRATSLARAEGPP